MKMLWTMRFLAKLSAQIFVTFMTVSKPDSATISACSQRVMPYRSLLHASTGGILQKRFLGTLKKIKKRNSLVFQHEKMAKVD
jgi:hypothetical protein